MIGDCCASLTTACFAIVPYALSGLSAVNIDLMVFGYGPQVLIVLDEYLARYLVKFSLDSALFDLFPVVLIASLDWASAELEWSFEPGVLLHAVSMGTIVDLDDLKVRSCAHLFHVCKPLSGLLEVYEVLYMDSSFLSLL